MLESCRYFLPLLLTEIVENSAKKKTTACSSSIFQEKRLKSIGKYTGGQYKYDCCYSIALLDSKLSRHQIRRLEKTFKIMLKMFSDHNNKFSRSIASAYLKLYSYSYPPDQKWLWLKTEKNGLLRIQGSPFIRNMNM